MTTSAPTLDRPDTITDRLIAAGVTEERALSHPRALILVHSAAQHLSESRPS